MGPELPRSTPPTNPASTRAQRLEANIAVVQAKVDSDLEIAVAEAERKVTAMLRGPLALVAPIARGVLHYAGHHDGRKHVLEVVQIHVAAARDAPERGIEAAIERHLPDALAHDDFLTRMDWKHPSAPEAAALVSLRYRERIPAVSRLLNDGIGTTYEDLIRSTIARKDVETLLANEFATGRKLMEMAETQRGLLRVPRPVMPHVIRLARDMLSWYEARAADEVKKIYGAG
ncbi:MAG: hypothetical protein ACYDDF_12040 [Thermoplasmatota archaeon]